MSVANGQNGVKGLSGVGGASARSHMECLQGRAVAGHADEQSAGAGLSNLDVLDHSAGNACEIRNGGADGIRPTPAILTKAARELRGELDDGGARRDRVRIGERSTQSERDDVTHQQLAAIAPSTAHSVGELEAARQESRSAGRARRNVRVAVVGGGIAGLEAARELQARDVHHITIYEDRSIEETPSYVAAGLIEPVAGTRDPAGARLETDLFSRSMPIWEQRNRTAPHLVGAREVETYCSTKRPPLPWADDVHNFRQIPPDELHPAYRNGEAAKFSTYVVETPRYLTELRAQLRRAGVKIVCKHVADLEEICEVDAIVNASGLGAGALANDATMFRGDGHVVLVRPAAGVERVFIDESREERVVAADPLGVNMLYVIPRRFDVVLGGTLWDNPDANGSPEPLPEMPGHLLSLAAEVEPRLAGATPLAYRVASRPRRHAGVRLDLDLGGQVPLVHCYGQGGSGWTVAPALAESAVELLASKAWAAEGGAAA